MNQTPAVAHFLNNIAQKSFIALIAALLITSASSAFAGDQKVVRAALDLGSADFKLCVAEVSDGSLKILLQKVISVGLGHDYNANQGTLSEAVQKKALAALEELRTESEKFDVTSCCGIATAVFRKASNGEDLLTRLQCASNIPLKILTQQEEGRLGFLTGLAIFPDISHQELLLLDIGGSSVQITGEDGTYGAEVGNSNVTQMLARQVRKQEYVPDTLYGNISFEEILQLSDLVIERLPDSDWMLQRIGSDNFKLAYYDYPTMIHVLEQLTSKKERLTFEEFEGALKNLGDPTFELKNVPPHKRQYATFCLVLPYSLMKKFGLQEINLGVNNTGNAPGLALDESFWQH